MASTGKPRRFGRGKSETPHPIDVHVGSRVRLRRLMRGMSQEQLGAALGLTFQQVQKYERGTNRIGASRLYHLGQVLDVPPAFFYDDMDPVRAPAIPGGFAEPPAAVFDADPLRKRETIELVEGYFAIANTTIRRRLLDLARALAAEADGPAQQTPSRRAKRARRQHRT
jgi:transcriptional regulator with XRE-family HTH domain